MVSKNLVRRFDKAYKKLKPLFAEGLLNYEDVVMLARQQADDGQFEHNLPSLSAQKCQENIVNEMEKLALEIQNAVGKFNRRLNELSNDRPKKSRAKRKRKSLESKTNNAKIGHGSKSFGKDRPEGHSDEKSSDDEDDDTFCNQPESTIKVSDSNPTLTTPEVKALFTEFVMFLIKHIPRFFLRDQKDLKEQDLHVEAMHEEEPEEEPMEREINDEDFQIVDEKNLRESGKVKVITNMTQIEDYTVVVRRGEDVQQEVSEEHTMYVFKEGRSDPIFSYIIARGSIPLSLDAVILRGKSAPVEELQVLMIVDDQVQKKVCLQYVLVAHKKYKNIMYSTAGLEGSPNYLRVRTLKNEFDMLLNVGNMKFIYLRYQKDDLDWFNKIRETHIMYQLYPQSDTLNKTCLDFRHEIMGEDDQNSKICFLSKSGGYHLITISTLTYCNDMKSYKIQAHRSLREFISDNIVYGSAIFGFFQGSISLGGIGWSSSKESTVRVCMHFKMGTFTDGLHGTSEPFGEKLAIEADDKTLGDNSTRDQTEVGHSLAMTADPSYDYEDKTIELPVSTRILQGLIQKPDPGESIQEIAGNFVSRVRVQAITDPIISEPNSTTPIATSTIFRIADEPMLIRYNMTARSSVAEKLCLGRFPIMDPFITEEGERIRLVDRCCITSLASVKSPIVNGLAADLVVSINKGLIVKLKVRLQIDEPRSILSNSTSLVRP